MEKWTPWVGWRAVVRNLPLLNWLLHRGRTRRDPIRAERFPGSGEYWENRYAQGGNSGAGSYNQLALFKARILNQLVRRHSIRSVIEFGCGDGAQLALAEYPCYVGIDVSRTVIDQVRARFEGRPEFRFLHSNDAFGRTAELGLSLDVIYHLVEDQTFERYMHALFDASTKFVAIYSSNKDEVARADHVRHRRFTEWVELNRDDFVLQEVIRNEFPFDSALPDETSFADFYIYAKDNAC